MLQDPLQNYQLIVEQCKRWYTLTRKQRRQHQWSQMFKALFRCIFPDVQLDQLLINDDDMLQYFHLLLSSSFTYHQKQKDQYFTQNSLTDLVLLVQGKMEYQQYSNSKWKNLTPFQILYLPASSISKNDKITYHLQQASILMKCQKKLVQKLKNDLLRQDRDNKEQFMSNYLFCGFTPVYNQNNLKVIYLKEGYELELKNTIIYIIFNGLIRRKKKKESHCVGSQLTKGCILSYRLLSVLIEKGTWFLDSSDVFGAKVDCTILTFDVQEMARILKLNVNLKKMLQNKLVLVEQERNDLKKKAQQLQGKFTQRYKMQNQSVKIHYSIDFKARPKTPNAVARSFRRKNNYQEKQVDYTDFITFDRYDKMIQSKQRVMITKQNYQSDQLIKVAKTYYGDYQKKLKIQNKMMKIQSGKIQKISQRDSRTDCNGQKMQQIKKNLFQITNLFDQPLKEIQISYTRPTTSSKRKTYAGGQQFKQHKKSGVCNLKPEQFLKNEYLSEFLNKSRTRYSLKDLTIDAKQMCKQNMQKTDGLLIMKKRGYKITYNQIEQ